MQLADPWLGREVRDAERVGDEHVGSDPPVHEEAALAGGPAVRADQVGDDDLDGGGEAGALREIDGR
jgi:hypothetical protein